MNTPKIQASTAAQRAALESALDDVRSTVSLVKSSLDPKFGGYGTVKDVARLQAAIDMLSQILNPPAIVKAEKAPTYRPTGPRGEHTYADDALEAFMARKHSTGFKPYAGPRRPTFNLPKMTESHKSEVMSFNDLAVTAWRRLGHEVIVAGTSDLGASNVCVIALGSESWRS
jgi:hypothetical protein